MIASNLGYKSMNLKLLYEICRSSIDHEVTGEMEDISADICKKYGVFRDRVRYQATKRKC